MSKKEKKSYVIKHYALFPRTDKNNKIVRRWEHVSTFYESSVDILAFTLGNLMKYVDTWSPVGNDKYVIRRINKEDDYAWINLKHNDYIKCKPR